MDFSPPLCLDGFYQFYLKAPSPPGSLWDISEMTNTADFFRSRLDEMIELGHPLAVLAPRMLHSRAPV